MLAKSVAGRGGGMGDSVGKGGSGLARRGGCWRVSGCKIFSSAMRVLGLSGQWEYLCGEAH